MPISESGQLSLGNIATEKGESLANISLATLSTNNINTQSPYYPDGAQPHSVSEFYGYDHNAGPSGPSDPILHYYELVGAYPSQVIPPYIHHSSYHTRPFILPSFPEEYQVFIFHIGLPGERVVGAR